MIKVTGADGFEKTWISKAGETFDLVLKAGDYKFVELAAPAGYQAVTTTIEFTVAENGNVTVNTTTVDGGGELEWDANGNIILKDAPVPEKEEEPENPTVEISKTSTTDTAELPGAALIIKNDKGETVETFVSGTEPTKVKLAPGAYTLTEVTAPKGYEVAETISFVVDENGLVGSDKVHMKDAPTPEEAEVPEVIISKTAVADSAELPGAALIIKNDKGETVETFVSGTEPTKVKLAPGAYTLTEITAPKGYEVAETISFVVDENGLVGSDKVHMEDAPTPEKEEEPENPTVEISKTSTTDTAELPGAKLVITQQGSDMVVAQHTSTEETWKVQLAPGNYTLTEITAPKGYEVAESINFTVDENGLVGSDKVHMEDAPIPEEFENPTVEISKTSTTDTAELPGAKLVITQQGSDMVVAQHTSTEETWKVQLAPGNYTLTEITAPKGYEVAESINFTVDENGLVGSDKVHMEDAPVEQEEKKLDVLISKQDAVKHIELPGAELMITDVNGSVVDSWTSTGEVHTVQLAPGAYTLTETKAPQGYLVAEPIVFVVDDNGLVGGEMVTMRDIPSNSTQIWDDNEYNVILNKTWVDASGNEISWPEGRRVTFTLQYFDGSQWKDYYKDGAAWVVTLDNLNPSYTFTNLPAMIGSLDKFTTYRAVETKVDGYYQAISSETDLANYKNTITAVNRPETSKSEDEGEPKKDDEKIPGGRNTDDETTVKTPGGNTTSNNGKTTPGNTVIPGRTTTGTNYVPSTTRRVVPVSSAGGSNTVSTSRATATGDHNSIIWIVMAAAAAAAIAGAAFAVRRRRHED